MKPAITTRPEDAVTRRGARAGAPIGRQLAGAAAFLTRLPLPAVDGVTGGWAYGVIGAALGGLSAIPLVVLGGLSAPVAALLALGLLALVSGALHLDGLADTTDALAAPTAEAAERARTDPRVGAAGIVALVLTLGLEWAVVAETLARGGPAWAAASFVVAGAVSRAVAPLMTRFAAPAGRSRLGRWFAERTTTADALVGPALALGVAFGIGALLGELALGLVAVLGLAAAVGIGATLAHVRRGLDGDGFGATIELSFAATVLVALLVT